ncbi:protein of unknown function [Ralstonia solanacearum CFBP2957]|nr:protein of unknown function [Ralstonia solanacearum CFBP2957]
MWRRVNVRRVLTMPALRSVALHRANKGMKAREHSRISARRLEIRWKPLASTLLAPGCLQGRQRSEALHLLAAARLSRNRKQTQWVSLHIGE